MSHMKKWQEKAVESGSAEWIEEGVSIQVKSTGTIIRRRPDLPGLAVKDDYAEFSGS